MTDPVNDPREHGERRFYRAGCRCDDCTAAETDYQRGRRGSPNDSIGVALEGYAPPGDWIQRARCKSAPTAMFFPERGESTEYAKAICRRCPVLAECADYAIDAPLALSGVWVGMSGKDRRRARLTRRLSA